MPGIKIQQLADKLEFLYSRDLVVNSQTALAAALGIAVANISRFLHGNDTTLPEVIPTHHYARLCSVFSIHPTWLEKDIGQFKKLVDEERDSTCVRTLWTEKCLKAAPSAAIAIVPVEAAKALVPEETFLPAYRIGQRVYVDLDIERDAAVLAAFHDKPPCAALFSVDSSQATSCLFPAEPGEQRLKGQRLILPASAPQQCLRVTGPVGVQSVVALLSKASHAEQTLQLLRRENSRGALDSLARSLSDMPATDWRMIKYSYEVYGDSQA